MTVNRRRFLQFISASTGLAIAAGCGQRSGTPDLTSLGIGWVSHSDHAAPGLPDGK